MCVNVPSLFFSFFIWRPPAHSSKELSGEGGKKNKRKNVCGDMPGTTNNNHQIKMDGGGG